MHGAPFLRAARRTGLRDARRRRRHRRCRRRCSCPRAATTLLTSSLLPQQQDQRDTLTKRLYKRAESAPRFVLRPPPPFSPSPYLSFPPLFLAPKDPFRKHGVLSGSALEVAGASGPLKRSAGAEGAARGRRNAPLEGREPGEKTRERGERERESSSTRALSSLSLPPRARPVKEPLDPPDHDL